MNSMPEPTQPGTQINDSLVQDAIIALAFWTVDSPEDAARLLQSWKRRPEMTDADVAEVCERMFPEDLPLMDCPAWCTYDHSRERYNEVENLCGHYRDLLVDSGEHGPKLEVSVNVVDNLSDRYRNEPGIHIYCDEPITPDQAVRLIGAVSEGLRILA